LVHFQIRTRYFPRVLFTQVGRMSMCTAHVSSSPRAKELKWTLTRFGFEDVRTRQDREKLHAHEPKSGRPLLQASSVTGLLRNRISSCGFQKVGTDTLDMLKGKLNMQIELTLIF
jgi:hypothetical protein